MVKVFDIQTKNTLQSNNQIKIKEWQSNPERFKPNNPNEKNKRQEPPEIKIIPEPEPEQEYQQEPETDDVEPRTSGRRRNRDVNNA